MRKLLTHLFILAIIRNEEKAQAIVDIIYDQKTTIDKTKQVSKLKGSVKVESVPTNDKRKEVLDAIQFLKNKENKTKADREKIQMLEVVLKSV